MKVILVLLTMFLIYGTGAQLGNISDVTDPETLKSIVRVFGFMSLATLLWLIFIGFQLEKIGVSLEKQSNVLGQSQERTTTEV